VLCRFISVKVEELGSHFRIWVSIGFCEMLRIEQGIQFKRGCVCLKLKLKHVGNFLLAYPALDRLTCMKPTAVAAFIDGRNHEHDFFSQNGADFSVSQSSNDAGKSDKQVAQIPQQGCSREYSFIQLLFQFVYFR